MKELIRYAHCTKATPGQLDRHPYCLYEVKEVSAEMTIWRNPDDNEDEWIVRHEGKIIANESLMASAIGSASYWLMCQSRIEAERKATWHEQSVGNPNYATHSPDEPKA